MHLIQLELKKFLKDKRFFYLTIILFLSIVFLFVRNELLTEYVEREAMQEVESHIRISISNDSMIRSTLESNPEHENLEHLEHLQGINEIILDTLYDLRSSLSSDDWRTTLTLENEFLLLVEEYKNAEGDFAISQAEIERTLAFNQKLLDENIQPEHDKFSTALPNFLKMVVGLFINLGAMILILLFVGDLVSTEFENHSINLMFTQPLNKKHIIMSKTFLSVLVYTVLTFIVLGTTYLLGTIFGNHGTFNYPVLIEKNGAIAFITIADYIKQGLIVVSATALLVITLSIFYSLILKHTLSTLLLLLGTAAVGYVITLIPWKVVFWFNPFQYIVADERILFQNGTVWYQGIAAALVISIFLILVNLRLIRQR